MKVIPVRDDEKASFIDRNLHLELDSSHRFKFSKINRDRVDTYTDNQNSSIFIAL